MNLQAKKLLDEVKKAGHEIELIHGTVSVMSEGGMSENLKHRLNQELPLIIEALEEMQEESNLYTLRIGRTHLKMICPPHYNLEKTKELVNSDFPETINEVGYV